MKFTSFGALALATVASATDDYHFNDEEYFAMSAFEKQASIWDAVISEETSYPWYGSIAMATLLTESDEPTMSTPGD